MHEVDPSLLSESPEPQIEPPPSSKRPKNRAKRDAIEVPIVEDKRNMVERDTSKSTKKRAIQVCVPKTPETVTQRMTRVLGFFFSD